MTPRIQEDLPGSGHAGAFAKKEQEGRASKGKPWASRVRIQPTS